MLFWFFMALLYVNVWLAVLCLATDDISGLFIPLVMMVFNGYYAWKTSKGDR